MTMGTRRRQHTEHGFRDLCDAMQNEVEGFIGEPAKLPQLLVHMRQVRDHMHKLATGKWLPSEEQEKNIARAINLTARTIHMVLPCLKNGSAEDRDSMERFFVETDRDISASYMQIFQKEPKKQPVQKKRA